MTTIQRAPVGRSRIGPAIGEMQEQLGLALGWRTLQSGPPRLRARRERLAASRAYAPPGAMFAPESARLTDLRRGDFRSRPRRALMALGMVSVVASCAVVDGEVRHMAPYISPKPAVSVETELFAMALEEQFLAKAENAFNSEVFEDVSYFTSRAKLVDGVSLPRPPAPVTLGLSTSHPKWREAMSMRRRLLSAIESGAHRRKPELTASAQADYECWVRGVSAVKATAAQTLIADACHMGASRALKALDATHTKAAAVEVTMPGDVVLAQLDAGRQAIGLAAATPAVVSGEGAALTREGVVSAVLTSPQPAPSTRVALDRSSLTEMARAARPVDGDYVVFFEQGSTALTQDAESNLRIFISDVAHRDMRSIILLSHSDTSGSSAINQRLSVMRAKSVREFLRRRLGPSVAIDIRAFGETRPPVPTGDGVDEALNRRVELLLEG